VILHRAAAEVIRARPEQREQPALLRGEVPGRSIPERQEAIRELRDQRDLREALEVELRELIGAYPRNEREREVLEKRTRALGPWGEV